jgi:hypothetical protein
VLEDIQAQRATKVLSDPDGLFTFEGLANVKSTVKRLELGCCEVEDSNDDVLIRCSICEDGIIP